MSWTPHFDNTQWQQGSPAHNIGGSGSTTWSGSLWVVNSNPSDVAEGLELFTGATWNAGYRPNNLRITMAITAGGPQDIAVNLEASANGSIGFRWNYITGAPGTSSTTVHVTSTPTAFVFPLTPPPGGYTNPDIFSLYLYQPTLNTWTLDITNIEFGDGTSPPFWQDRVKCLETD